MTVDCPTCDRSFDTERGVSMHHVQTHGESIAGVQDVCDHCGEDTRTGRWTVENYNHTFCSESCHREFRDERTAVECAYCGAEKLVYRYQLDRSERFYCDDECHDQWRAENNNGPDHPNWRGGKSMYDAVKRALGQASWKTCRKRARERGGGTCAMCGGDNGGENLHAHHIVPVLAGGSNHPENLMLLCRSCHTTVEAHTRRLLDPVLTE